MQFTDYKIADIKDKTQVIEHLARMENDISRYLEADIVLIAYQKDSNHEMNS